MRPIEENHDQMLLAQTREAHHEIFEQGGILAVDRGALDALAHPRGDDAPRRGEHRRERWVGEGSFQCVLGRGRERGDRTELVEQHLRVVARPDSEDRGQDFRQDG